MEEEDGAGLLGLLGAVGVDVVGVVVPEGDVREREAVAECDAVV